MSVNAECSRALRMAALTSVLNGASVASRTAISTYSLPLWATVCVTPRLPRILYAQRSPFPSSRLPDDGNAHVERLQCAVGAAEGHRIEHEVDNVVASPILRVVAPLRHIEIGRASCRERV